MTKASKLNWHIPVPKELQEGAICDRWTEVKSFPNWKNINLRPWITSFAFHIYLTSKLFSKMNQRWVNFLSIFTNLISIFMDGKQVFLANLLLLFDTASASFFWKKIHQLKKLDIFFPLGWRNRTRLLSQSGWMWIFHLLEKWSEGILNFISWLFSSVCSQRFIFCLNLISFHIEIDSKSFDSRGEWGYLGWNLP